MPFFLYSTSSHFSLQAVWGFLLLFVNLRCKIILKGGAVTCFLFLLVLTKNKNK